METTLSYQNKSRKTIQTTKSVHFYLPQLVTTKNNNNKKKIFFALLRSHRNTVEVLEREKFLREHDPTAMSNQLLPRKDNTIPKIIQVLGREGGGLFKMCWAWHFVFPLENNSWQIYFVFLICGNKAPNQ